METTATLPLAASRTTGATPEWRAYAALAIGVLGITWGVLFVRWAGVPGVASAFYRVFFASMVLVPWWLARTLAARTSSARQPRDPASDEDQRTASARQLRSSGAGLDAANANAAEAMRTEATGAAATGAALPGWRPMLVALAGGLFFACDLALFNTAVLRTSATTASLLGNNSPIFVGLGAWLLLRQRPRAAFWTGLALALVGCAIIVIGDVGSAADAGAGATTGDVTGDLLAVAASVFFAAYLMITAEARAHMDTLTFTTLAAIGSVAGLAIIALGLGVPLHGYSWESWASLLGLGLFAQLVGYFAITYALGHLPATLTSVGILAQTPLTALLALPLLGEALSSGQIIGGLLVLAGIYVVNRGSRA